MRHTVGAVTVNSNHDMRPIFLVGYMGSGKSTLGRALGDATGLQFIDLDTYIERRFHANIRDIFAERGEEGFRDIERRMVREVCEFEDVIVACGGGTPCFFDNMDVMNASGTTVFLRASTEKLHERLKLGRRRRPLIAAMNDDELLDYIMTALEKRMPHYGKASCEFCADYLDDAAMIRRSVREFAKRFGLPMKDGNVPDAK